MSIRRILSNSVGKRKKNTPKTGTDPDYLREMLKQNTKQILWSNIHALMQYHWGKENLSRLSREAKIGPASCSRLKEQETSVGLEIVEAVAGVFGLHAWQILIPDLEPTNPPVFVMSDAERQFYNRIRNALNEVVVHEPPHVYETANGIKEIVKDDRRVGGRRSTDRH